MPSFGGLLIVTLVAFAAPFVIDFAGLALLRGHTEPHTPAVTEDTPLVAM